MKYQKYEPLLVSTDALEYKFNSTGPKGNVTVVVQFVETDDPSIYNLAFGNLLEDGRIDDKAKNGNHDRNKILATVAIAVYEFTAKHPGKLVVFTGNTAARTRLYRMAISNNFIELSVDFDIYGIVSKKSSFEIEIFEKGKHYEGFVVQRK